MADIPAPVEQASTPTPLAERLPGRGDTVEPKDNITVALDKLLHHAEARESQHRRLKADADGVAKELRDLGVKVGEPVSAAQLPLNRGLSEKAITALKSGKLKVKSFQEAMGFFDQGALSRVRKALIAAGVTVETAEGSVVFVSLTEEFAPGTTGQSS